QCLDDDGAAIRALKAVARREQSILEVSVLCDPDVSADHRDGEAHNDILRHPQLRPAQLDLHDAHSRLAEDNIGDLPGESGPVQHLLQRVEKISKAHSARTLEGASTPRIYLNGYSNDPTRLQGQKMSEKRAPKRFSDLR